MSEIVIYTPQRRTVECPVEGCQNKGIPIEIEDNGLPVICGPCSTNITPAGGI